MRAPLLLLPLSALIACASPSPYVTTVGILKPGKTISIQVASASLAAYQPASGQRRDLFTISATALPRSSPPPAPAVHAAALGLVVRAPQNLASLLVRVPDGVDLVVESQRGDVNVTDIGGNGRIIARRGNVDLKLPGYAQAAVGEGNLSVMMGSTVWPGTLYFSTSHGNVEIWIEGKAAFGVHLHTDDGTLFTDFGLRGVSDGAAETIDGSVNGGSPQRVDVRTHSGAIRLLRLAPQP